MKTSNYLICYILSSCFWGCTDPSSVVLDVLNCAHESFLDETKVDFQFINLYEKEYFICFPSDYPGNTLISDGIDYRTVQLDHKMQDMISKKLSKNKTCKVITEEEMMKKSRDKSQKNNLIINIYNFKQHNDMYHVIIGYVFNSRAAFSHSYLLKIDNGCTVIKKE